MKRLWLLFAQVVTVLLAMGWVLITVQPGLLLVLKPSTVLTVNEASNVVASGNHLSSISFADAASKALPSVVNVLTAQEENISRHPLFSDPMFRRFFGEEDKQQRSPNAGLGSGVIVSSDGYIITNHHVVAQASKVSVALSDGRVLKARVVGTDAETDLAVLQVMGAEKLPAISLRSEAGLRVGDVALAIGNPFGVGQTVTMGIISALGRSQLGLNTFENFIQTDAAINPGNSGGALIDTKGNLIGINTAIYSRSGGSMGIGFSIPVSVIRDILQQVVEHGEVVRGWIGVEIHNLAPELSGALNLEAKKGGLISGVVKGGPAEDAGIKAGDLIVKINDKDIVDSTSVLNNVAALKPKDSATIVVYRGSEKKTLTVKIGQRPVVQRR